MKLPLGKPATKTYLFEAFPLSILAAHGDEYKPWLLSNYIQLDANRNFSKSQEIFLTFYGPQGKLCPYLDAQKLSWTAIMTLGIDLHQWITTALSNGYYITCIVDQYYIEDSPTYMQDHSVHDVMIYGYDEEAKMYSLMVYDKNMMYTSQDVSYEAFEKAFKNNFVDKKSNPWADFISVFKYRENIEDYEEDLNYKFNLDLVKHLIQEYLTGTNTLDCCNRFLNPHKNKVYGIDVYKVIEDYNDAILKSEVSEVSSLKDSQYDVRLICVLLEHKELMVERLKYIEAHCHIQTEDLTSQYVQAVNIAKKVLSFNLKYIMTKDKRIIEKINPKIRELKAIDEKVLTELLARIG